MSERRPKIGTCVSPYSGGHSSENIRGLSNPVLSSPAAWADTQLAHILDTRPDIAMVRRPLGNDPEPADPNDTIRLEYLWWNSTERHPQSMTRPDAAYENDYSSDYKKLLVELTKQVHRILTVCKDEGIGSAVYIGPIHNYRNLDYTNNVDNARTATEELANWAQHYGVDQVIIDSGYAVDGFYEAGKVFRAKGSQLVGEGGGVTSPTPRDTRIPWCWRASRNINQFASHSQFRNGIPNYGLLPYWIATGHEEDNGDVRLNLTFGGSGTILLEQEVFQGATYETATATGIVSRVTLTGTAPFILIVSVTGTWAPGLLKLRSTGGLSGWSVQSVQRAIRETPEELHEWYDLGYQHFWGWTRRGDQLLREAFPLDGLLATLPLGDDEDSGDGPDGDVTPVDPE